MRARLIRVGNSRGVRLPKPLIEEAGLSDDIDIRAGDGVIVIANASPPRAGWEEAARQLRARDDDRLLERPTSTRFDDEDWDW